MPSVTEPPTPSAPNPGSQSALRRLNQQRVVDALLAGGPSTQTGLARRTGLSSATISNIVKTMTASGVVDTVPTTSSGRRALSVRLSNTGAVAVGIDFGRRHLRIVLATVSHHVVDEEFVELPLGLGASESIDAAAVVLSRLLESNGLDPESVLGVGVGVPGPIDRRTGTVVQGAILPGWVGVDTRVLEARLEHPVWLDNDANLGALAEVAWGPHGAVSDLMFVKIGSGIGSGLILNGSPHRGAIGITGEIGHAPIIDEGIVCRCGKRGCLETVASISTMISRLAGAGTVRLSTRDLVRRALTGDPETLRVLDDAGLAVGRALAGAANLVNPEVIVVGGPLSALGGIVLDPIARGLARHAVPAVSATTSIVMSSLGDRAEALGAVTLVLQQSGSRRSQSLFTRYNGIAFTT